MIESEKGIDAYIVAVPNFLHADVTVAALNAGKHVLTEKPMANHLADADRMMRAAKAHKRLLQVGLQSRYGTVYKKMIQLMKDGAIGDLEYVQGNLYRGDWNPHSWKYRDPRTEVETNWRFLTGGRVVSEQPRYIVLRDGVLNHLAHHRGQLTVYLRLNNVPVPSIYGPSADERPFD